MAGDVSVHRVDLSSRPGDGGVDSDRVFNWILFGSKVGHRSGMYDSGDIRGRGDGILEYLSSDYEERNQT